MKKFGLILQNLNTGEDLKKYFLLTFHYLIVS